MNEPVPAFRINIWRTQMKPAWYAYTIYRDRDHNPLAGGECKSRLSAEREAKARVRQLQGAPS